LEEIKISNCLKFENNNNHISLLSGILLIDIGAIFGTFDQNFINHLDELNIVTYNQTNALNVQKEPFYVDNSDPFSDNGNDENNNKNDTFSTLQNSPKSIQKSVIATQSEILSSILHEYPSIINVGPLHRTFRNYKNKLTSISSPYERLVTSIMLIYQHIEQYGDMGGVGCIGKADKELMKLFFGIVFSELKLPGDMMGYISNEDIGSINGESGADGVDQSENLRAEIGNAEPKKNQKNKKTSKAGRKKKDNINSDGGSESDNDSNPSSSSSSSSSSDDSPFSSPRRAVKNNNFKINKLFLESKQMQNSKRLKLKKIKNLKMVANLTEKKLGKNRKLLSQRSDNDGSDNLSELSDRF